MKTPERSLEKKQCLASYTQKKTLVWLDSSVQKCVSLEPEWFKSVLPTCFHYRSNAEILSLRWKQLVHLPFFSLRLGWLDRFSPAGGKTMFLLSFWKWIHAHMPVVHCMKQLLDYWKISFLQMYSLLSKLAQLQLPFVFDSPDLIYGNYLQACVVEKHERE